MKDGKGLFTIQDAIELANEWRYKSDITSKVCGTLLAEIERLQAIVDKLPKTADSVPVVPGMTLYYRHNVGGSIFEDVVDDLEPCSTTPEESIWAGGSLDAEVCYSTREAAGSAGGE